MTQNQFTKLLRKPKKDRPVLEFAMTAGEVVSDSVMRGDVLEAVPFVNLAFKAVKAKDSIRDAIFAQKLIGFVNGFEDFTPEDRARLSLELATDEGKKAGETLILVLDRVTDLDKPALLGFLFKSFAAGKLNSTQLRRLSVAVDAGFSDDLAALMTKESEAPQGGKQDAYRRLMPTGLTYIHVASGFDTAGETTYHLTQLGALLFQLVNNFPPIDSLAFDDRHVPE